MASHVYTPAKTEMLTSFITGKDIRVILVMSNTTADTDQDAEFVGDITTLDEMDGANYVRKALASEAVAEDAANNRAEFDAVDVTWTALGAGTRAVAGAVLYEHVTNDADSPVIQYIDTGGFPFTANGSDVTVTWNAEGITQVT